jgi:hypothetical protein
MEGAGLRFMLMAFAGWWRAQQQEAVTYLIEENRILRGQLRGRRLQLTDDERRRLAARGHRLGRRGLRQVATLVTPDTIQGMFVWGGIATWNQRNSPGYYSGGFHAVDFTVFEKQAADVVTLWYSPRQTTVAYASGHTRVPAPGEFLQFRW